MSEDGKRKLRTRGGKESKRKVYEEKEGKNRRKKERKGKCRGVRVEGEVRKTRVSERSEMEAYKRLKKLIDTSLMFTG